MTNIAEVIGWKFNHQLGMQTADNVITKFPGGVPSQADQDTWTTEYDAEFPAGYYDWVVFRTKRNVLLASSDWTQYTDSPLDEAKAEWATYRQELRDLPASTEDPTNPTWPDAP